MVLCPNTGSKWGGRWLLGVICVVDENADKCEGILEDGETKEWNVSSFVLAKQSLKDHAATDKICFESIEQYLKISASSWETLVTTYESNEYTEDELSERVEKWKEFYGG
jgi:hypothetical protein